MKKQAIAVNPHDRTHGNSQWTYGRPSVGSKVFDGSVSSLKDKYGQIREMKFETDSKNASERLGYAEKFGFGEDDLSVEQEGALVTVRFNSSVAPISDVLGYTLQRVNVSDINVKDADIEEIIRRLYKQGVEE